MQPTIDAKDAIFIDESGCHPSMGPLRDWPPVGERLLGSEEAYSGGRRLSLVAAMDVHGIRRHAIVEGGVKGTDFLDFVRDVLGPSLRPGKVVVMDNLRLHKNPEVVRFLQARGCRSVFVPPYSPDTNPIELVCAKIQHLVRKAAARSVLCLRAAFDAAWAAITAHDARNYIDHAGYW